MNFVFLYIRFFVFFSFVFLYSNRIFSQSPSINSDSIAHRNIKKNSVYVELLGNAGLFSLNYDRVFLRIFDDRLSISGRIGGGVQIVQHDSLISYRIPFEINAFLGKTSNNHFEVGLGYTPFIYKSTKNASVPDEFKNYYLIVIRAGYRYQQFYSEQGDKKILPFGRAAIEGFVYQDYKTKKQQIRPFISICLGFSFGFKKKKDWYYD